MYLKTKIFEKTSEKTVAFANDAIIKGTDCPYLREILNGVSIGEIISDEIVVNIGITDEIKEKIGEKYAKNDEGFAIVIGKTTYIYAESEQAVFYAAATLKQLFDFGELCEAFIYDYPLGKFRGFRTFVPARFEMDDFRHTVDMLAYYKYNSIMIQVSGAMEYKKHPEINETMEKVAKELLTKRGSAISHKIYNRPCSGYHPANCGGSYISQEETKELIKYCQDRGLEVIPEVPSLSHCEYLVTSHPEIKEDRREVKLPTAYCPSNPRTYEILFDVLDEIIDVFKPRYINIGHDELYSIGICDKCKNKAPEDLFAEDVIKIHDYLASKNIKTMMWGDKLVPVAGGRGYNKAGDWDYVPPLFECIDKLPKDIVVLNWYYPFGAFTDKRLIEHGFTHTFGNFWPSGCLDYKERSIANKSSGAFVSIWGPFLFDSLHRNHALADIVLSSYLLWCDNYTDEQHRKVCDLSCKEQNRYVSKYWKTKSEHTIVITHTTDYFIPYSVYYKDGDAYPDNVYKLGSYIVTYTDGTTIQLPVKYGVHISNEDVSYDNNRSLYMETASTSLHSNIDGKTYFTHMYDNPHPEKTILGITFFKTLLKEFDVRIKCIEF